MVIWLICLSGIASLASCARVPGPAATPPAGAAVAAPPVSAATDAEFRWLQQALADQVPQAILSLPTERTRDLVGRTQAALAGSGTALQLPTLLVVVDRNPKVQELFIVLARADRDWQVVGGSHVSTGQAGRRGYFITPTGVFVHTDDILDYRAEGTYNENHIRGLGLKGMRVWDFGWVPAVKGWRDDGETGDIRLLLHATDPDVLERRLGRTASKGCIRVPATMNEFLDKYGILDTDYEAAAAEDPRVAAVLRPDRTPTPLAGHALVVIDSSGST